jgi:polysaccharide pyruvyl transferase WcaK-like protein
MKAGLLGTYGYGNLGDAAIQDAVIQNIRLRYPDAELYGFSLNPGDTEARHGIHSYAISRMSWSQDPDGKTSLGSRLSAYLQSRKQPIFHSLDRWLSRIPLEFGLIRDAYRNLRGLDLLIVSGGGQLDDYWAGGGPWSHPYTLLKFGILSRLRGVKYIFISVGAGPLAARLSQRFVKLALRLAAYRSYRDVSSRQLIEGIGFDRTDPIYPDLAHSLQVEQIAAQELDDPETRLVGIGPIGYFKPGCWPEPDTDVYQAYLQKLTSFAAWLVQRGYQVVFLPGEAYYDQLAIADVKALLAEQGYSEADGSLQNPPIESVGDLLIQIRMTKIVIASRFHGVLLSQLLGKPVIALSYHSKIDDLMQDTGQAKFCQSVASFEVSCLQELFVELEHNQGAVKCQVKEKTEEYRKLLDEQYERIFSLL